MSARATDIERVARLAALIRRILHRIACAWMQCDEARG